MYMDHHHHHHHHHHQIDHLGNIISQRIHPHHQHHHHHHHHHQHPHHHLQSQKIWVAPSPSSSLSSSLLDTADTPIITIHNHPTPSSDPTHIQHPHDRQSFSVFSIVGVCSMATLVVSAILVLIPFGVFVLLPLAYFIRILVCHSSSCSSSSRRLPKPTSPSSSPPRPHLQPQHHNSPIHLPRQLSVSPLSRPPISSPTRPYQQNWTVPPTLPPPTDPAASSRKALEKLLEPLKASSSPSAVAAAARVMAMMNASEMR